MHQDKRHGPHGDFVDPLDGSRYIGGWFNDQKSGRGKIWTAGGSTYEGNWMKNRRHGRGTSTYTNGDSYEGYYVSVYANPNPDPNRHPSIHLHQWRLVEGYYVSACSAL